MKKCCVVLVCVVLLVMVGCASSTTDDSKPTDLAAVFPREVHDGKTYLRCDECNPEKDMYTYPDIEKGHGKGALEIKYACYYEENYRPSCDQVRIAVVRFASADQAQQQLKEWYLTKRAQGSHPDESVWTRGELLFKTSARFHFGKYDLSDMNF